MLSELFVTHDRSRAIDFALPCPEVGHIGLYSQETTADIHKRHPGAVSMDEADFMRVRELQFLRGPVVAISEGEFYDAYEMMPPYYTSSDSVAMSFQSSEATSGRITRAYCRVGESYCWMYVVLGTSHLEIVTRASAAISAMA